MNAPEKHFDRLVDLAEERGVPLSVQIELTGRCNLRCKHCYLDLDDPPEELSTDQWKSVLTELAGLGTMFLSLTGGELFLRRDAFEIAHHARSLGMALRLFTSGTRFRRGDLDRVAALHPIAVEISLYSATASVHDGITSRPGSHRRTLKTIVGLRRRGVPVIVKAPILKPNLGEIAGIKNLAERVGAAFSFDPTTITRRDGRCEPVALRPSPSELASVLSLPFLRSTPDAQLAPKRSGSEAPCAIARRVAVILPNGDVMPCSLHPVAAGNVRQGGISRVWSDSPLLVGLRSLTVSDLDESCSGCEKNGYCGRCSALALLEDGSFFGPSRAACDQAEAREITAGTHRSPRTSPSLRILN